MDRTGFQEQPASALSLDGLSEPLRWMVARIPGLSVVLPLAILATVLGHLEPAVGSPVFAVVGGIGVSLVWRQSPRFVPGFAFASKGILQLSIVLLGTGLSLQEVGKTGVSSLPEMLGSLTVALVGAAAFGRLLAVEKDVRTLIGVGTGICGASAIAATDSVISASEADVSYAIATIFTFNVAAVLTFPAIGHLIELTPHSFGLWAGTAVNDMSSVVAASSIFGHGATSSAVVVKLTRTVMIIPISVALAMFRARRSIRNAEVTSRQSTFAHVRRSFPKFIGIFLVAVVLNTAGMVPVAWHGDLNQAAQLMITMALAAIGLSTRVAEIRRAGFRPLALGAILWVLVGTSSLGLQMVTGTLR